ncbi:MAG: hypothetical protein M3Y55_08075 [Pseudomonadota bacterium]|nr:hypothetical protein [Pseudomonadota bacterium]
MLIVLKLSCAFDSHFGLVVPTGRAISPITHGNWEGNGVAPDVKVNAGAALVVAQRLALTKLIASETDEARKATQQKRLDALR